MILNVAITVLLISANCLAVPGATQDEAPNTKGDNYLMKVLLGSKIDSQSQKLATQTSDTATALAKLVNNEAGVDIISISTDSLRISSSAIGQLLRTYSQQYIKAQYANNPVMQISLTVLTDDKIRETVAALEDFLGNASLPLEVVNQALAPSARSAKAVTTSGIARQILQALLSPVQARLDDVFSNITTVLDSLYDSGNSSSPIAALVANARNKAIGALVELVGTVQTNVDQFFSELINGTNSLETKQLLLSRRDNVFSNAIQSFVSYFVGLVQDWVDSLLEGVLTDLEEMYIDDLPSNSIAASIAEVFNKIISFVESKVTALQETIDTALSSVSSSVSTNTTRQVKSSSLDLSEQSVTYRANFVSNILKKIVAFLVGLVQDFIDNIFESVSDLLEEYYMSDLPSNPVAAVIANAINKVVLFAEEKVTAVQEVVDNFFSNILGDSSTNTTRQLEFFSGQLEALKLSKQEVTYRANVISNIFQKIVSFLVGLVQGFVDNILQSISDLLEEYYITDLPSNPVAAFIANATNKIVLSAEEIVIFVQELVDNVLGGSNTTKMLSFKSDSLDSLQWFKRDVFIQKLLV